LSRPPPPLRSAPPARPSLRPSLRPLRLLSLRSVSGTNRSIGAALRLPASLCEAIHPSATQLPAGMLPAGTMLAGMLPVGSGTTFVRVEYLAGKETPAGGDAAGRARRGYTSCVSRAGSIQPNRCRLDGIWISEPRS